MGKYVKEARNSVERIQHYYGYAGSRGYSQAKNHYFNLSDLIMRADRSKHDRNDAIAIRGLMELANGLMEEMRKREASGSDQ